MTRLYFILIILISGMQLNVQAGNFDCNSINQGKFSSELAILSERTPNSVETGSESELASDAHSDNEHSGTEELNVKEFILHHLADDYTFNITTIGENHYRVPLPVILYSHISGWHFFWSSHLMDGHHYEEFYISHDDGKYKGKILEHAVINGVVKEVRPLDFSITKIVFSLLFNSLLLVWLIMWLSKKYKKDGFKPKTGLAGFMEIFIMDIHDNVIKPTVGKDYRKYAPYLLTVFFFIFINNLMGLIPIFPGGASVTGNIAVTFVLALITFVIVNASGTKEYWKEIFWPDVPAWLKVPIPLMPAVEIIGIFTKPFALMIRLFANMLAGHAILLGLASLIFVTVKLGVGMNSSMTVLSVLFSIFINLLELLVAYIQAYVFTLLSALFIGLAKVEPHHR